MHTITVQSSSHAYDITVAENIRFQLKTYLPKSYKKIMIVTDEKVADLYLEDVKINFQDAQVFCSVVPSGEQSKSIDMYYKIQTEAIEHGLDRRSLIIALGGGVVGDLAGFVAATFLRGVDYIQIPTTILAHDSSVGGKVAINHQLGKNLIGSFYPPRAVIYDVETLQSLEIHEVRSGYAELVKEAFISDPKLVKELLETRLTELSNETLATHLQQGIKVKADIVEADERESGVRMYLNLGHTLAHALEAELGYGELTHGEAVAIGMLFAIRISERRFSNTLPYESLYNWMIQNDYPVQLPDLDVDQLIARMHVDKKVVNQTIQMVLLKDIGQPVIQEVADEALRNDLQLFLKELKHA